MKTHQTRRGSGGVAQERTFQEYLAVMLRGKWIILITFLVVLLATILFTKLVDPTYQATAKVLLNSTELRSSLFLDAGRVDGVKNIVQNWPSWVPGLWRTPSQSGCARRNIW
jgi:uncharacterized protein involved in exopolysaccharide biosynthesis